MMLVTNAPARELPHTDTLAEWLGHAKQIGHQRLAKHTDLPGVLHVIAREQGVAGDAPGQDREVGWGHPAHLGAPILVTVHDLHAQVDVRGQLCREGDWSRLAYYCPNFTHLWVPKFHNN
jgi:hypothetical protein